MITAAIGKSEATDLHLFRNYDSPEQLISGEKFTDELVWKVARATIALPDYIEPFELCNLTCHALDVPEEPMLLQDASLFINNLTLMSLTEIATYNNALSAEMVNSTCQLII